MRLLEKYKICSRQFVSNEAADLYDVDNPVCMVTYIASRTFEEKRGPSSCCRKMGESEKKRGHKEYAGVFTTVDGYHC